MGDITAPKAIKENRARVYGGLHIDVDMTIESTRLHSYYVADI